MQKENCIEFEDGVVKLTDQGRLTKVCNDSDYSRGESAFTFARQAESDLMEKNIVNMKKRLAVFPVSLFYARRHGRYL
nr:hypothetical protein [Desulforamulus ruminis]